jgi:Xaa-Pro aminopeptidase
LFVSPLSSAAARKHAKNCVIAEIRFPDTMYSLLAEAIRSHSVRLIYLDSLTYKTYLELAKRVDTKFVSNPELILNLRMIKDENEQSNIRKACEIAGVGVEVGAEAIKPGVKEYEVAAEVEYAMRVKGSEGVSFETIVASGPRSAFPHGVSSSRTIRESDLVILDLGATYAGYCSDITRTFVAGKPLSRCLQILNLVFKAQNEAFSNIRAGVKGKDVDAVARKVIADNGYGEHFIHGLGHGVGLDVHESPMLSPTSKDTLQEGNIVTDEPGVYIEGFGGVRIEDTVLVRENRGERLTVAPYYMDSVGR